MSRAAILVGFDSAWADRKPGAICSAVFDGDCFVEFREPELVLLCHKRNRVAGRRGVD